MNAHVTDQYQHHRSCLAGDFRLTVLQARHRFLVAFFSLCAVSEQNAIATDGSAGINQLPLCNSFCRR
jgi:hypothetical protein